MNPDAPRKGTVLPRPLTRRQLLQAGSFGALAVLLAQACGPGPLPSLRGSAGPLTTPTGSPVPLPSASPLPPLGEDQLTGALAALPGTGTLAVPGGGSLQVADLQAAAAALAAPDGAGPSVDLNPVAALGYILAAADWSGMTGAVALDRLFPGLALPVVRLPLARLPGGGTTAVIADALPAGLTVRAGAALLVLSRLADGNTLVALDDPARPIDGHPRLELGVVPDAALTPLLAVAGARLDPTSRAVVLADGTAVTLRPLTATLASRLTAAAGVLFVDRAPIQPPKAKTPVLTLDPIVPPPADLAGIARVSQAKDGRVLALDAAGTAIGRAAHLGDTWQWADPDKAAGLDYFLRELADGDGVLLGMAPDGAQLLDHNAEYLTLAGKYFNQAELSVTQAPLNPGPGQFSFGWLDDLLAFATSHAMRPFSYLLWSYGAPQWLRDGGYSTAKRVSFAQQFVTATMTRYRGQIKAWQVFNEPVWATVYGSPEQRFWQDSLGADFDHFVAEAFHWARAADPSATLLLTDYVNEGRDLQVTQSFYNLVEELVAGGTPLDAVGIETHFHWEYDNPAANPQFSPQVFADWIGKYQQLGVEVWITEFDVDMTGFVGTKQAEFAVQAQWYRDYLQAALDHGVTNFTIFGLTDNTSWYNLTGRPNASALILNSDFTPKPAYFAVRDVLKKRAGLT